MSDIFISYASEDRPRVERLAQLLEAEGWSVWWDRHLPIGKTFDDVIEEALETARCVIVVWTEASVASRWVRTEAAEGVARQIIVPLMLEAVRIPLAFRRIQTADLVGWAGQRSHAGFDQVVTAISDLLGEPKGVEPGRHAALASSGEEQEESLEEAGGGSVDPGLSGVKQIKRRLFSAKTIRAGIIITVLGAIMTVLILNGYPEYVLVRNGIRVMEIKRGLKTKLVDFVNAEETVKQVAFGPDGIWMVLRNRNFWWQKDIFPPMRDTLQAFTEAEYRINQVAFAPNGGWVILRDRNDWSEHNIPDSLKTYLQKFKDAREEIKQVAFARDGSWVILRGHNNWWQSGIPDALRAKLQAFYDAGEEIKQVAFAPNGGWVILHDHNKWSASIDFPEDAQDALDAFTKAGKGIRNVAFAPDGGWVVVGGA